MSGLDQQDSPNGEPPGALKLVALALCPTVVTIGWVAWGIGERRRVRRFSTEGMSVLSIQLVDGYRG